MKVLIVARSAFLLYILAPISTYWQLAPGLHVSGIQFRRLAWIIENPLGWAVGWWLWVFAIFVWMWLLFALMSAYLPAHRQQLMFQAGLLVMAGLLAIIGAVGWWRLLPVLAMQKEVSAPLVLLDAGVLGILGLALLLAGIVTTWIGFDLWRQHHFPVVWVSFLIGAGLLMIPSPLLLPSNQHLLAALGCWLLWCGYFATRRHLPTTVSELK